MTKRPIPKSSGLYCLVIDDLTQTGVRKKISPDNLIWLEVLSRSEVYKVMPDSEVRIQLKEAGFENHLIESFISMRTPVPDSKPFQYLSDLSNKAL